MKLLPDQVDEGARLATLRGLDLVDRELSRPLTALLEATLVLLDVDTAVVGLVDAHTVHLKGIRPPGLPPTILRPIAFSTAVLDAGELLVVEDTRRAPRFAQLPPAATRFLAGCPLHAPNGHCLGAFTVGARMPRSLDAKGAAVLQNLTRVAEALITHQKLDEVPTPAKTPIDEGGSSYDPTLLRLLLRKHAAEVLGHLLDHSPARFKDLIAAVPGLNQRTLTTRLEELKARGLVTRRAFDEIPPRVQYNIPPERQDLVRQLLQLAALPEKSGNQRLAGGRHP